MMKRTKIIINYRKDLVDNLQHIQKDQILATIKFWRQLTNDIFATYTSFCKFHMCKGTLVYKFLLKSSLEGVVLDYKNPLRIIQKLLLSLLSYLRYLAKQTFKNPRYSNFSQ